MIKGIQFRIYPTESQKELLAKSFGSARFVYNWALDLKSKTYQTEKKSITRFQLDKQLTNLKKEQIWLKEIPSQVLQQSLSDLDSAFTKFFKEKKGYPKFKKKHAKQSIRFPQGFELLDTQIKLPKLGKVKAKISKDLSRCVIKNITISQNKSGKHFASICYDDLLTVPTKAPIDENQAIGIDVGIKTFIVTSEAEEIENPKFLKNNLQRLKVLQRRMTKKTKGSKNRNKARIKVAKHHEKISNMRKDFLHKTSTTLIKQNNTICIEDLNVAGMLKNHKLAQAIQDVSWSEFFRMLDYKAEWHGKNLIKIGRFWPSTILCDCGTLNKELALADRIWTCKNCGVEHQRDVLAAKNIKKFAFLSNPTQYFSEIYTGQDMSGESVESSAIVEAVKQKPAKSAKTERRKESNVL
jgi:putative transposase